MPGDGILRREREDPVHITLPTRIEFSEVDHWFEASLRKLVCDLTRQTIFWQEINSRHLFGLVQAIHSHHPGILR